MNQMSRQANFLITGSSRGLGRGLATHYAESGHVVFGCSRGEADFVHSNYHHHTVDVANEREIISLFSNIKKEGGKVDVLINNAGIPLTRHMLLTSAAEAEKLLATNLLGAFLVIRETVKQMKRENYGRVINFTSIGVPLGASGCSLYSAAKSALEHLAFSLSRELAGSNITFNTIGPSIVAGTGMVDNLSDDALSKTRVELLKPETISIEEVAHAIDFFRSDAARNVTNQIVYFGGVR